MEIDTPAPPVQNSRHALAFIAVTLLLDTTGFGLIMPVYPRLLVDLTGESLSRAAVYGGWLGFLYAAMQFVWAPVLGNLSDRYGRRRVLLFAIGALGIDYIVMGFAPTLAWLFVGRAISGAAGASFTPAYAYVADITPPEKRAQSFGVISASFGIGFIIGPAIGGLLGSFGPRTPFFVAAALSLVNFCYGYFVLPESLPPERRRAFEWRRANPLGTLAQMRKHPVVLGLLAALFLWALANQVMPTTWAFYTKFRFGWSEAMIGASLATAGVIIATSQATMMRYIVPRLGERKAALIGIVGGIAAYAGFGLATAGWMMFASLAGWFFGAIVMPTINALMSHRIAHNAQGELQGAVASLFSLSAIMGPPIMTHIFARFASPVERTSAGRGVSDCGPAGDDLSSHLLALDARTCGGAWNLYRAGPNGRLIDSAIGQLGRQLRRRKIRRLHNECRFAESRDFEHTIDADNRSEDRHCGSLMQLVTNQSPCSRPRREHLVAVLIEHSRVVRFHFGFRRKAVVLSRGNGFSPRSHGGHRKMGFGELHPLGTIGACNCAGFQILR